MLQVTNSSIIYMASTHIDFRKGIDSICAICRNHININPLEGAIFLFYNRHKTAIKVLAYDGQGFWLCAKRLSTGSFIWKSQLKEPNQKANITAQQICYRLLYILINNGSHVKFSNNWRNLNN